MELSEKREKQDSPLVPPKLAERQKRIPVEEARKYFRKRDHNARPTVFWQKKEEL